MRGLKDDAFWLVLSAVDGQDRGELDWDSIRPDGRLFRVAADLATANGLYYPFIRRWLAADHPIPAWEGARWSAELDAIGRLRRSIETASDAARERGIDVLVIKNCGTIEHVPRDLDLFVRPADGGAFIEALADHGLEVRSRDEAEISLGRRGLMRIDLYTRIHYLGRDFLDAPFLLGSRELRTTHGVPHAGLNAEAALLMNSVHAILGHGGLSMLDFLDLRRLRRGVGDPSSLRPSAEAFSWGNLFDLWMETLDGWERRVFVDRVAVGFPFRYGWRFLSACVDSLEPDPADRRRRFALAANFAWDGLIGALESSGLARAARRSGLATRAANSAGHRLRILRGDRKGDPSTRKAYDAAPPAGRGTDR